MQEAEYLEACQSEMETQKSLQKQIKKLPFVFTRLYVRDFQGIHKIVIDTISPDVQWIFLTGENGYGKTSILRAIATGLIGDEGIINDLLLQSKIYINGVSQNKTFIYEPQPKTKSPLNIPMAAYGAARYQLAGADHNTLENNKKSVTYSLFYDNGQLINIEQELIYANAYNRTRFAFLVKVFKKIIPYLAEIEVIMVNGDPKIQYSEQNEEGKRYPPVYLQQLAAGYRNILMMVGDMMIRLSKYPNNPLRDLKGIVLIDEIDAHLHPKYQYQLPKLLSELFPKIQFIVTTHNPIPILSLPKSIPSVVLTVSRTIEMGITIDRKDSEVEIHRLNPNALLTSPIFGFQQLFAPDATPKEIIPTDNYDDVTAIQEMKKRLKSLREQGLIR
jgi:AAA15 family ATPase/GTPase